MLQKLRQHLDSKFPFLQNEKLAIAVSGGLDSMVLTHLMLQLHYNVAVFHCNFLLRGAESNLDQDFVTHYCKQNNIPCFTVKLDADRFASDNKISIQMAARALRYQWFEQQLQQQNIKYLLTAHHANDSIESFFINLSRGSGSDGLMGIPSVNNKIVRPLLPFFRVELEDYAAENSVQWREDASNATDNYLRNKIRHHLIPTLNDIESNFSASILTSQYYLQQTNSMAEDAAVLVFQKVAQMANDEIHFNLNELTKLSNYQAYLYRWLREYNFTAWNDVYALVDGQTGKQILSPNYRLFKNRHFLILSPLPESTDILYEVAKSQSKVNLPLNLTFTRVSWRGNPSVTAIFVDLDKLAYPLLIRKWREGDYFYPSGMKGKSKKVSKFFKDEKFSLTDKEKTWLLCSENQIVWIIGSRQDHRFIAKDETKNILKIALS